MRCFVLALLLASLAAAEERKPASFTCHRASPKSVNPRAQTFVQCDARDVFQYVPEWRLFGSSEEELMFFDVGMSVRFEIFPEWHLLEMSIEDARQKHRLRAWLRTWHGQIEFKPYGAEGQ